MPKLAGSGTAIGSDAICAMGAASGCCSGPAAKELGDMAKDGRVRHHWRAVREGRGGVHQRVVGAVDVAVVVEVAVGPAGDKAGVMLGGESAVDQPVVHAVDHAVEVGVAVVGVARDHRAGVDGAAEERATRHRARHVADAREVLVARRIRRHVARDLAGRDAANAIPEAAVEAGLQERGDRSGLRGVFDTAGVVQDKRVVRQVERGGAGEGQRRRLDELHARAGGDLHDSAGVDRQRRQRVIRIRRRGVAGRRGSPGRPRHAAPGP